MLCMIKGAFATKKKEYFHIKKLVGYPTTVNIYNCITVRKSKEDSNKRERERETEVRFQRQIFPLCVSLLVGQDRDSIIIH